MSLLLLGLLISGLIFGSIAYNCYMKREAVERSLRKNIETLEHNIAVIKKESAIALDKLDTELKKTRESNKKAYNDIDMLSKDVNSLKGQLEDCEKKLREC